MRTLPLPILLAALALAALLAARPRVTHDELVLKVEALEDRVKALEAARPKVPVAVAPQGEVKEGMTQTDLEALLASKGITPSERSSSDERGAHFEFWDFEAAEGWNVKQVMLRDGVVRGVYYFPSR